MLKSESTQIERTAEGKLRITIELDRTEGESFLEKEEHLALLLNQAGLIATQSLLKEYDDNSPVLAPNGVRHYLKGEKKKRYESPYGPIEILRSTYQGVRGGVQYVPLESKVGMLGVNTPRYAKQLSWKYAHMPSERVAEDLAQNHLRQVSRSHIQRVSYDVGEKLLALQSQMQYRHGIAPSLVKNISVGRDGAMLRLKDGGYREAMVGTISLVGAERQVLHTIYLGDGPEYGKAGFEELMRQEIALLKGEFGHLPWVGLADGSVHNWAFLNQYTSVQIIDYWHCFQYIRAGLEAIYPQERKLNKQIDKWHDRLKEKQYSVLEVLKIFKKHRKILRKQQIVNEALEKGITYLSNHHQQMNYAKYLSEGYLIGSGVTESACKTLIKNRFCGCGMKWEEENTRTLTLIRGLVLTTNRWQQAWQHMSKVAA